MALMGCTHSGASDDVHRSSGLHIRPLCASVTHLEGKHQHLTPLLKRQPGLWPRAEAGADLVSVHGPEPLVGVLVRPQLQIHTCGRELTQHSSGAQDQSN